jgi:hypothetical protein
MALATQGWCESIFGRLALCDRKHDLCQTYVGVASWHDRPGHAVMLPGVGPATSGDSILMVDRDRAVARREALQEMIGMFEDGYRGGDTWRQSIAARRQRAIDDPDQWAVVAQELYDLIDGAVIAGAWLGGLIRTFAPEAEWAGDGSPPPDFPGQDGWPWTLLREMASKVPFEGG